MKYVANNSFGKDSLAMIISRVERNEPVDLALYCNIRFNELISAEHPLHEEWVFSHAIPLLESKFGVKTEVVVPKKTYCEQFYTKKVRGKCAGSIYGFPLARGAWCNSKLKVRALTEWAKKQEKFKTLVGIAADEKQRIQRHLNKGFILPLVEYGITEDMAVDICKKHDLLSPAYSDDRERFYIQ